MYSVADYRLMALDSIRIQAYTEALRRTVRPDSVVLDIGAGTGLFSLLACQFGARRVYAIEPNDAIQVGRDLAARNGYADRIEFIQRLSTDVVLPEKADVIVSDLRGVLPLCSQHIPVIAHARANHLAEGGVQIPQRDTLWAALVNAEESFEKHVGDESDLEFPNDFLPSPAFCTNAWTREKQIDEGQLIVDPASWATLDYTSREDPNVKGKLEWVLQGPSSGHGIYAWFESVLLEDIGYSNPPGAPALAYGRAFFPWPKAVKFNAGDRVRVTLKAKLLGDEYLWQWKTKIYRSQSEQHPDEQFVQSSFESMSFSTDKLRCRSADYVPDFDEQRVIDRLILELMDQPLALREIADALCERYPAKYNDWDQALAYVGEISARYSKPC